MYPLRQLLTVCIMATCLCSAIPESANAGKAQPKPAARKAAPPKAAAKRSAALAKRAPAPKKAPRKQPAAVAKSKKPAGVAARSITAKPATGKSPKRSSSASGSTQRGATAAKPKKGPAVVAKGKKPRTGGASGKIVTKHPDGTSSTVTWGLSPKKASGGSADGTQTGIRDKVKSLHGRWDLSNGDNWDHKWTDRYKHPTDPMTTVVTSTLKNGDKVTRFMRSGAYRPTDKDTKVVRRQNGTIDTVVGVDLPDYPITQWLQVLPDGSKTYRDKDGTVIKKDGNGRTIYPVQQTPAPPANDGKRRVVSIDRLGYDTKGRPLPGGGRNGDKSPEGSVGADGRPLKDFKSVDDLVSQFGNTTGGQPAGEDSSNAVPGSSSSSGSSGSSSNSGSSQAGGDGFDAAPGSSFPDDSFSGDLGAYDNTGGDDDSFDNTTDDSDDSNGDPDSGDGAGGDNAGGAAGDGGGQAPPAGLEFPDDDSAADPPKSDGFEPAPGGFGDDHNNGSGDSGDGDGSDDGSGDDGSDDDGSDDDGSDDDGSDDDDPDNSSEVPSDNSGVGYTPSDPDQAPVRRGPATAALRDALRNRVLGGNGNNTTPTDDDSGSSGKGDTLVGNLGPAKQVRTKEDLIGMPRDDRSEMPAMSAGSHPGFGPDPNEVMPTPDAEDPQQPRNSGPPIVNQTDTLGNDGSGQQQPGSNGGATASNGSQDQTGSAGTSQSAARTARRSGPAGAAVERFLKLESARGRIAPSG